MLAITALVAVFAITGPGRDGSAMKTVTVGETVENLDTIRITSDSPPAGPADSAAGPAVSAAGPEDSAAGTCEDVTSIDWNWNNDMLCTRSDGSTFYTDYAGAERFEMYGDE